MLLYFKIFPHTSAIKNFYLQNLSFRLSVNIFSNYFFANQFCNILLHLYIISYIFIFYLFYAIFILHINFFFYCLFSIYFLLFFATLITVKFLVT